MYRQAGRTRAKPTKGWMEYPYFKFKNVFHRPWVSNKGRESSPERGKGTQSMLKMKAWPYEKLYAHSNAVFTEQGDKTFLSGTERGSLTFAVASKEQTVRTCSDRQVSTRNTLHLAFSQQLLSLVDHAKPRFARTYFYQIVLLAKFTRRFYARDQKCSLFFLLFFVACKQRLCV